MVQNLNRLSPARALLVMRIIWFVQLLGPLMFMGIVILLILPNGRHPLYPQPVLARLSFAMLATIVPAAFVIRRQIHKRSATEAGIPIAAHSNGNIVFWACCEFCAFFGLVAAMVNASLWPTIVVVAIALSLQALTIPMAGGISFSNDIGAPNHSE